MKTITLLKNNSFKMLRLLLACVLFMINQAGNAQSCANYTVARATGATYSSIASSSTVISSWRGQVSNQDDDNRSYSVPIGFDFWYLGTRYTTVNVNVNGFIDFSTSTYDGNWPSNDASSQPPGYASCSGNVSYREDGNAFYNVPCGSGVAPNSYDGTYWALAPMYCDLFCRSSNSLANSIRYKTTGTAPNRVFTVEYINMDDKAGSSASDYNFQVKLTETTGVIRFQYGTMTAAPGAPSQYVCGINGNILTNPPAASELLAQQSNNSGTFSNTLSGKRTATPTSNSKLTFTPPVPANPGASLTFSSITNSAMTLNWSDWASNETGYVIYSSTDGVTYSYLTQTASNSSSYAASSLISGTTYYWKVYAVTEGCLSSACSGSQATLAAGTYTSVATGNWSNPATWDIGAVPTIGDNVIIANGHTVTVNGSYSCYNLTVGQGSSGKLLIGSSTTPVVLTVAGDLKIKSGASMKPNTSFAATHTLTVKGNIANSATFNMKPSGTSLCNVTFNKNGNQNITGSGGTTAFNLITLDMGSSATNILDVKSNNFSAATNFLTLTNGTFKFSVPANAVTLNAFTSVTTIGSTCGITMNSSNGTLNIKSTLNYLGNLTLSAGTINMGDQADECLISNGANINISGGTINFASRLDRASSTAITNLTISGGNMILNTVGSTSATSSPFMIDAKGSTFNMTAGNIIIRMAGTGGLGYYNRNCSSYTFSGGTLMIGDGSTPASQTMNIYSDNSINALWVNSFNSPTAKLSNSLTVSNNVDINSTSGLDCNSQNLTIGGTLTNDGTFTSGTNVLTFNGSSAQQLAGASASLSLNDLTISNSGGDVSLNYGGDVTINGVLNFSNGKLILNSNNLIIASGSAITGYTSSSYVVTNGSASGGGYLQINNLTTSRDFPIGTSTLSYSPILNFANTGTSDHYQARVYNGVIQSGLTASNMTNNVVNKTWVIEEVTPGGSLLDVTLEWDTTAELTGFSKTNCAISYYDAALLLWDTPASWGAATANPSPYYNSNRTAIVRTGSFSVHSNATGLPVELTSFDVYLNENMQSDIVWQTASETNNDYFTVEHSTSLLDFKTLAVVKGAGTSNHRNNYTARDFYPTKGFNYYRLKQTDFDGTEKYFPVKSVYVGGLNESIANVNFFPDQRLQVQIRDLKQWPADISIIDSKGSMIQQKSIGINNKETTILFDCNNLPFGIYHVIVNQNNRKFSAEFLKN